MKMRKGVAYFGTYREARDVATKEIKGHAWRIVRYTLGWAIQYRISGPYFPELQA